MKTKRHTKILELIAERPINTQEDLLNGLRDNGFDVTQATVSRDIKELRLVKILGSDGKYRYATAVSDEQMDMSSKFHAIFKQSVKSIDYAKNIIVIKCYTGMANAACAALDSMNRSGVVGTLAGDDTIFVLMNDDNTAVYFAAELKKMLG